VNAQLTPSGLTEVHAYSYSETDSAGYREGVIFDLLLFEDFTYKLRIKEARIKPTDAGSTQYIAEPNYRLVTEGEWFAHFNSEISLDNGIRANLFTLNGGPVVDITFPAEPMTGMEDLAGETLWLRHFIVEKAFDEDLTCP
jgi:hypothetical protein